MDFQIKKAKERLIQEIYEFQYQYGIFDLETYDLNKESINNWNKIPNLVHLGIDIVKYIYATFEDGFKNYGYHFIGHAKIMKEQVEILRPIADKMIDEEEMDISEILNQVKPPKVLPDGINYQKYKEIFDQLRLPSEIFYYIYVCENILRRFIIQILEINNYKSIESIHNQGLSKSIRDKKSKENKQNYLPNRGNHDIYYLDLSELGDVIRHVWQQCFADKFKDQAWIISKIGSLYDIRCRVAHSSNLLTIDELKSVETHSREIIKQIDPYIK